VNSDRNLCMYGKFGYRIFNRKDRIIKPLVKENGKFREISFENAYKLIEDKIKSFDADKTAFFAGARLTNEEQYLVQKLARVTGTNNVNSFHYLQGGTGFSNISSHNVPFDQIKGASRIFLFGSEINRFNPVVGYMINASKIPFDVISTQQIPSLKRKSQKFTNILSYYHFVRATNHYLLSKNLQNNMFINDNCADFDEYKKNLLAENYSDLCKKACDNNGKIVEEFAEKFNNEINAILVFSEREISQETAVELRNLALITGKLGKTASGIISLKEKNNSHGLFDMGVRPKTGVGLQKIDDQQFIETLKSKWGVASIPKPVSECFSERFFKGDFHNLIIFGEDPVGCSTYKDKLEKVLGKAEFIVVQDAFLTETAKLANLILPSSFWFETGGSFTNSQQTIQEFDAGIKPRVEKTSIDQLIDLLKAYGFNGLNDVNDIKNEFFSLLPQTNEPKKHYFVSTNGDADTALFSHGCDYLMKEFDREFNEQLGLR